MSIFVLTFRLCNAVACPLFSSISFQLFNIVHYFLTHAIIFSGRFFKRSLGCKMLMQKFSHRSGKDQLRSPTPRDQG